MGEDALRAFRDRFRIPISDDKIAETPFYKPADDSPEIQYLKQRRAELGGSLPMRKPVKSTLVIPELSAFDKITAGTGEREVSTTMAFVPLPQTLLRKKIGRGSWRERGCTSVYISVVAGLLHKKK